MNNPELIQALDFILNRSDEVSIEVLSEAVSRRRRDIALFSETLKMPDPERMAKEIAAQVNAGTGAGIADLRKTVQETAVRILREHAPDLTNAQIDELCRAWIPDPPADTETGSGKIPRDMLVSMIEQFAAFSQGTMRETEDQKLRGDLGAWPERYWKAFPPVVRSLISDFLKGKISEKEFYSKIGIVLGS